MYRSIPQRQEVLLEVALNAHAPFNYSLTTETKAACSSAEVSEAMKAMMLLPVGMTWPTLDSASQALQKACERAWHQ